MGILNVTSDSFSDGATFLDQRKALDHAHAMIAAGAAIIDIGGESTRPGAEPVSALEEQDRVLPVIEALAKTGAIVSVDTYRAGTARLALAAGAHVVNDVWGFTREPEIAGVVAAAGAGAVIMHTGRERERLRDVIADQRLFLSRSLEVAREAGVPHDAIVLDPGLGFAKEPDENFELLAAVGELGGLGHPLLIGASRKRFIGAATGRQDPARRDAGTAATSAVARLQGAAVFRVHDVEANRDALAIADAVLAAAGRMAGKTAGKTG